MRYGEPGVYTIVVIVPGGDTTEATIFGLKSCTTYTIEVAAINNAGDGKYSNPIIAQIGGKSKYQNAIFKLFTYNCASTEI